MMLVRWLVERCAHALAMIFAWLGALGVLTIPVVLLWQVYAWLVWGVWLSSTCIVGRNLMWQYGARLPEACGPFETGWRGVDVLLHWALLQLPASLLAGAISVLLFLLMMAFTMLSVWAAPIWPGSRDGYRARFSG